MKNRAVVQLYFRINARRLTFLGFAVYAINVTYGGASPCAGIGVCDLIDDGAFIKLIVLPELNERMTYRSRVLDVQPILERRE